MFLNEIKGFFNFILVKLVKKGENYFH